MREIKLTVTDVRKSMLGNLHQRLAEARIPIHRSMAHDITIDSGLPSSELFDVIICDVPCSGSGTWARTPEQHYSFDPNTLSDLTEKQFRIVQNARQHLSGSGVLAYITCSVFAAENEWVINRIREELKLKVAYQQYLNGIDRQADTLFVAYLTNA